VGFFKNNGGTGSALKVLRKGPAARVIFFYPGEEGTYVDNVEVILYENGIVQIASDQEESTTHLQNCEILWKVLSETDERSPKVRLLRPKVEALEEASSSDSDDAPDGDGPTHSV
jgi:hypothetical protein